MVLFLGMAFCYLKLPEERQPTFLFYSGTLILSMICVYISENTERRYLSILFLLLGLAILGYPMAFRLPIAIDDDNYRSVFYNANIRSIPKYFTTSDQEKGYLLLNWIFYRLTGGNYNYFQVAITYLTFLLWGIGIKMSGTKGGSSMFMNLFIWSHYYFFVLNSGLIRIFLAAPIVFIGIQYIWKGDWKKFTFWVVVASFIHLSSLVMLLFLIFLYKKEFFYKNWLFFVFLTIFVVIFGLLIMARFLIPFMGSRYEGYASIDDMSFQRGSFTTLPIWIACFYYFKNLPPVTKDYKRKYVIGMILLSLSIIFSVAATMVHVGRIIFYAYIGLLVLISAIFQLRTKDATELILKCLLIIYALVYVMSTNFLNVHKTQLFPYQTFLLDDL